MGLTVCSKGGSSEADSMGLPGLPFEPGCGGVATSWHRIDLIEGKTVVLPRCHHHGKAVHLILGVSISYEEACVLQIMKS